MKHLSHIRSGVAVLLAVALAGVAFQAIGLSQNHPFAEPSLTYLRDQSVVPLYHGWQKHSDGSMDLHFGYMNRNWQEELDIPVGPNNNISAPYGPDAGQPTHFLPRANRWQFKVRVPASFETNKQEVAWTLTSHGETLQAFSNLHAAYFQDEFGLQREFYGTPGATGNKFPEVNVENRQLTARVGEPVTIAAVATDDGLPPPNLNAVNPDGRLVEVIGSVGGRNGRASPRGLRFAWYVFRGAGKVRFNPPQYSVWEDNRSGANSPYSNFWQLPAVPPGNRWIAQVTFPQPGTYVVRGLANDGIAFGYEDVTVTVTP